MRVIQAEARTKYAENIYIYIMVKDTASAVERCRLVTRDGIRLLRTGGVIQLFRYYYWNLFSVIT